MTCWWRNLGTAGDKDQGFGDYTRMVHDINKQQHMPGANLDHFHLFEFFEFQRQASLASHNLKTRNDLELGMGRLEAITVPDFCDGVCISYPKSNMQITLSCGGSF